MSLYVALSSQCGETDITACVFFLLTQPLPSVLLAKVKQPHTVQSFLLELTFHLSLPWAYPGLSTNLKPK